MYIWGEGNGKLGSAQEFGGGEETRYVEGVGEGVMSVCFLGYFLEYPRAGKDSHYSYLIPSINIEPSKVAMDHIPTNR